MLSHSKRLWRITSRAWALDRQCEGTRLYGGRWNPIGSAVLYAATTVELCALEKFVHLGALRLPDLVLVAIDLPDAPKLIAQPALSSLPPDWADLPSPASAQAFGQQWLDQGSSLALLLPSAVVPEAHIALINPQHPRYAEIKLEIMRPFRFDSRMWG